jgi:hypothetical protein
MLNVDAAPTRLTELPPRTTSLPADDTDTWPDVTLMLDDPCTDTDPVDTLIDPLDAIDMLVAVSITIDANALVLTITLAPDVEIVECWIDNAPWPEFLNDDDPSIVSEPSVSANDPDSTNTTCDPPVNATELLAWVLVSILDPPNVVIDVLNVALDVGVASINELAPWNTVVPAMLMLDVLTTIDELLATDNDALLATCNVLAPPNALTVDWPCTCMAPPATLITLADPGDVSMLESCTLREPPDIASWLVEFSVTVLFCTTDTLPEAIVIDPLFDTPIAVLDNDKDPDVTCNLVFVPSMVDVTDVEMSTEPPDTTIDDVLLIVRYDMSVTLNEPPDCTLTDAPDCTTICRVLFIDTAPPAIVSLELVPAMLVMPEPCITRVPPLIVDAAPVLIDNADESSNTV